MRRRNIDEHAIRYATGRTIGNLSVLTLRYVVRGVYGNDIDRKQRAP